MRKIARLLVKIGWPVIFMFVCLEALMTILDPYLFKGFYEYDPDLGFRVRPYSHDADGARTNRFGFNARDYPLQKTPGTVRILVVGDSYNWAGGRDGNYTALLERKFRHGEGEHKIDVINAGYPQTHPGEELAMLKKYGLQYNPDLVVLGFFMGNDFFDGDPDRKRIVVNGIYVDISRRREMRILGYPIVPQSRLLLLLQQKYKVYAESRRAERDGRDQHGQRGVLSEETYLLIEKGRLEFFSFSHLRSGTYQSRIDYILRCISEMNELLKSRRIKFVVAIYPDVFQVNEKVLQTVLERFGLAREDYDLDPGRRLLKPFLDGRDIPYIDLTDRFRAEGTKQDLYLFRGTHWNSAGNRLAADILFDELAKRVELKKP
jgi:hypothetical protein